MLKTLYKIFRCSIISDDIKLEHEGILKLLQKK
jgi:hypothetical protein